MNSNRSIKLVIRTMAVLIAGIIISIAFLSNVDTFSWFTSSAGGSVNVTAAETWDIIGALELLSDDEDQSLTAIKIKKADGINYDPLIYFSVEGEAANYINHINPVRLEDNIDYIVPIVTDVNLNQFSILAGREENVSGKLRIKYLNEFVDEAYDISFSPKYLTNRLMKKIVNEGAKPEIVISKVMRMAASAEPSKANSENSRAQDTRALTIKAIETLTELVEWKGIDAIFEDGKLSNEALFSIGLEFTKDQEFLLDIMYPGLKEYAEGLKSYIGKLKAEIEYNNAKLASLDEKLLCLESEYDQLLEENAKLTDQINSMTLVQPPNQPPAAGGGGDTGTGDTGEGDTGEGDVGDGDTGEGDVGDGDTGEGDTGEGDTGDGDTGEGDTGDGDTGEGDVGEGDTGEGDIGEGDTGEGDTEEVDTGEGGTGEGDTGDDETTEEPTDSGDEDDAVDDSDEEDNTNDTTEDSDDGSDTADEGDAGGTDSTDSDSETTGSISIE